MHITLSAPIMANWEVTPVCNHNCLHCYNYWRDNQPDEKLPPNYDNLFNSVTDEIIAHQVFSVSITGGEPLLVFDQICPFIEKLSQNHIDISLNSNLTLLTEKKAAILKEIGVRSILVSLPSADAAVNDQITNAAGSFPRIIRGIKIAQRFGFQLFINMVVSKLNFSQIQQTAAFVHSLGLTHFAATKASDPSNHRGFENHLLSLEEFHIMQEELEKSGREFGLTVNSLEANPICSFGGIAPEQGFKFCTAGKTVCTIGSDGSVRPCNRVAIVYGSITDGLLPAWESMYEWRSSQWIPSECATCKAKYRCMGGCKADAYNTYQDFSKPDPMCDFEYARSTFPSKTVERTTIETFRINPRLKIRNEKFGAILYVSTSKWLAVDYTLLRLFTDRKEVIAIEDIQDAMNINRENAISLATTLQNKAIISSNERKG
jgi:radical SAM protein with 4Fe4S-binding SPASM domain